MSDLSSDTALDIQAGSIVGVPVSDLRALGTLSILQALVRSDRSEAVAILKRCGVDTSALEIAVRQARGHPESHLEAGGVPELGWRTRVLHAAFQLAMDDEAKRVGSKHLLLALLSKRGSVAERVLLDVGVTFERAIDVMDELEQDAPGHHSGIADRLRRNTMRRLRAGTSSASGGETTATPAPSCMTETLRAVISGTAAVSEAAGLDSDEFGAEHFLLSLLHFNTGIASHLLKRAEIDSTEIRAAVLTVIRSEAHLARTSPVRRLGSSVRALTLAGRAATEDGAMCAGTHHLLLGLIQDQPSLASTVLMKFGLDLDRARAITAELGQEGIYEP